MAVCNPLWTSPRAIGAAILLIATLCLAAPQPARADDARPAAAASAISPAEAQQALDAMQDPAKRDALIETLRTIARVAPPAQPAPAAAPALLGPDGFGAEALKQVSAQMGEISAQLKDAARAATKAPLLYRWLADIAADPAAQAEALGVLLRAVAVAAVALLAELAVGFLLRRPRAALDERARRREPSRHGRLAAVARAPYALARLVLELAPVAAFAAAGNAALAAGAGDDPQARLAVLALVNAYVVFRTVMCVLRMIACSPAPGTSLLAVTAEHAAAIETWSRWIVGVAVFGVALASVARALGLDRAAHAALVRGIVLVPHLLLAAATWRSRHVVAAALRAPPGRTGVVAALRNRFAEVWPVVAIFANLALWAIWAFRIPNGYSVVATYAAEAIVVAALARGVWAVAIHGLDRLLTAGALRDAPALGTAALRYRPILRLALSTVVTAAAIAALLQFWGVDVLSWFDSGRVGALVLSEATSVALAVAIAALVWEVANGAIERELARLGREGAYARAARLRTLLPMLRSVLIATILTIAGLTVLSALGVNIAPLLAGAGIVGIAVGFGSQKLVQDVVTGVFLLLENAMQVGDWVTVAGLSGTVENLSIRTIRLRAGDGSVHIIPFSSVTSVTNTNRGVGNASVAVALAYDEDVGRAEEILKQVAREMRQEARFKPLMRADLDLWGVDKVDGAAVTLTGQIECTDAGRWPVQREFNRRMLARFQEAGVRVADPTRTRVVTDAALPVREPSREEAAE